MNERAVVLYSALAGLAACTALVAAVSAGAI